jgi:putative ABC transport system permease protein
MIRQIMRFWAIFKLALNRLLAQPFLSLVTIIGLTVAIALILTIPVYSESVAFRVLTDRLTSKSDNSNRPPFSYFINFIGSWNEPIDWEATEALDSYIREQLATDLGLSKSMLVRHFETLNFRLYPSGETAYEETNVLSYATFAATEDFFNQVNILEGAYPAPADPSPDSVIEVIIAKNFADTYGIQVGDTFLAYNWRLEATDPMQRIQVRIAGIWQAKDENSPYWFYLPFAFEDALMIHEDTLRYRISPYTSGEINLAIWYLVTDGQGVTTNRVDELIERERAASMTIDQLLPGTSISYSPSDELQPYRRIASVLRLTLTVFSIPIVALLVVFLMMIVNLIVDRQRNETAVLRSRGSSPFQVIGLAALEGLIIGTLALLMGTGLAAVFTRIMGSTTSFLEFGYNSNFVVSFPQESVLTAIGALLFTLILRLVPSISAAGHTIVSYKLSTSRSVFRPFLQRTGLDLLLLVIVAYFYYQTVQQGSLIQLVDGVSNIEEAYNQPFVFLLAPLSILGLSLFVLRLLPLVLRLIVWLIQLTDNVSLLIVTRQLERSPGSYYLPLILLITTIGLGIYTASFAHTIDRYLYEQQYYRVGADVTIRLLPPPVSPFAASPDNDGVTVPYVPIAEFRTMPGIEQATRIGQYDATARLTSGSVNAQFIGLDRADFAQLAFWRSDFADVRLGDLLNNLAIRPDTVLVPQEFMQANGLEIGDFVDVDVRAVNESFSLSLQIVGSFDYFPRWYPDEGTLFVGNLDYLFEQAQIELPHLILARVTSDFNQRTLERTLIPMGVSAVSIDEPLARIAREQNRPERQGLFGLLSIGFIASSIATVIGFLLYTVFSYQKRYVELGILRAVGLGQGSMMLAIAWELALLISVGLIFGLLIGLAVSWMYIPYMQFVSNLSGIVPPYLVTIAWAQIGQIALLFVLAFVVIMLVLIIILRRMRIFQAVKLGESL